MLTQSDKILTRKYDLHFDLSNVPAPVKDKVTKTGIKVYSSIEAIIMHKFERTCYKSWKKMLVQSLRRSQR